MPAAAYNPLLFVLLVALAVGGRLLEPQWCFTPTAAVAMFAGFYFSRLRTAALVPLVALAISDLVLPTHDHVAIAAAVYGVFLLPVVFGRRMQGCRPVVAPLVYGIASAVVFFLVTNFAVWYFRPWYPPTLAGLLQCYASAIPFLRWMATGDLFYTAVIFGAYAVATDWGWVPRAQARVAARNN